MFCIGKKNLKVYFIENLELYMLDLLYKIFNFFLFVEERVWKFFYFFL